MKKIYMSLLTAFACGSIIAQSAFNVALPSGEPVKVSPNTKAPVKVQQSQRGGPFSQWVEPVGDVMTNKGLLLDGSAGADQALYLGAVYMDSTARISGTTTRTITGHLYGSVLDPKSTLLQANNDPIVAYTDAYTLDSVVIFGSYVKVTPDVDTLYVTIVWGDTNNTAVWKKNLNAQTWVSPIGTWRTSLIGPLVSGAGPNQGNLVQSAAPSTNMALIKYVLTQSDSSAAGYLKYINIPLSAPISIPADNIVSCMATFVPGGTHNLGDVAYSFPGAPDPQVINGFGFAVWNQKNPALTTVNDYQDHQVDITSMCMGTYYQKNQRYMIGTWGNNNSNGVLGYPVQSPYILYKISGTSTVGINDAQAANFSLSQNTPNPFDGKSTIKYNLKADAKNVSFVVYDVKGSKVYENKTLETSKGAYSIELNKANFNSGIYFYSLTVDGNAVTKKMVVTK